MQRGREATRQARARRPDAGLNSTSSCIKLGAHWGEDWVHTTGADNSHARPYASEKKMNMLMSMLMDERPNAD